MGDRRTQERWAIAPRLYVVLDRANSDGILNDVSEDGAALDIVGSQLEGEYVIVDFEMSEIGQHFEAKARIKWRDEARNKVGVHFVDVPESSRALIKEWLTIKSAAMQPVQPAILHDADREGPWREELKREEPLRKEPARVEIVPAQVDRENSGGAEALAGNNRARQGAIKALAVGSIAGAGVNNAASVAGKTSIANSAGDGWSAAGSGRARREGEIDPLVQTLLDSFKPDLQPPTRSPRSGVPSLFSQELDLPPTGGKRKWILAMTAVCLLAALTLGGVAYRSSARNAEAINISKAGLAPNVENKNAHPETPSNSASAAGGDSFDNRAAGIGSGSLPSGAAASSPGNPVSAPPNSPNVEHSTCSNLGPASDKIRIRLWTEKDTPAALIATYTKYLTAVTDVKLVDKSPYDLVLYVNGANARAKSAEAGFIWSSRAFRPWYCGETLGLLEQTQVNESLHYVQGNKLDQHIQAEVAYLILHTFEAIRNEHSK